jgi:hypothetical protein
MPAAASARARTGSTGIVVVAGVEASTRGKTDKTEPPIEQPEM